MFKHSIREKINYEIFGGRNLWKEDCITLEKAMDKLLNISGNNQIWQDSEISVERFSSSNYSFSSKKCYRLTYKNEIVYQNFHPLTSKDGSWDKIINKKLIAISNQIEERKRKKRQYELEKAEREAEKEKLNRTLHPERYRECWCCKHSLPYIEDHLNRRWCHARNIDVTYDGEKYCTDWGK